MTTTTCIANGETPSINVVENSRLSRIDPLIYGGFIEHMGRCIYGGIYDPNNKYGLIDKHGFRVDVQECFRELNVPVVRWPGGNFTATYHWMDGIGPVKDRPKRLEPAWAGRETNEFGTDEFLKWCRTVGTEPYIALNMGTGTLQEAMAWLEYCNSTADTYYANLRRKYGQDSPYGVKYWALGNEVWGPWQVEQCSQETYAERAVQWAKALKMIDPSITLVLCGQDGRSTWDFHVLRKAIRYIDMHSIHMYTCAREHYANALAPRAAERAIETAAALIDIARTEDDLSQFPQQADTRPKTQFRPRICLDEWNIWDPTRAPGEKGAEETYNLSDMLGVSVWLNVLVRQSKHLGMATIAQSVNVISPLMTYEEGIFKQTTYWPLYLFSKFMRGHTIAANVCTPQFDGPTNPEWLQSTMDLSILDVSAAIDHQGFINMAVVNVSSTESYATDLNVGGRETMVYKVGGIAHALDVCNTRYNSPVTIEESKWDGNGFFEFECRSLTLLRWRSKSSNYGHRYGPAHDVGRNQVVNTLSIREQGNRR